MKQGGHISGPASTLSKFVRSARARVFEKAHESSYYHSLRYVRTPSELTFIPDELMLTKLVSSFSAHCHQTYVRSLAKAILEFGLYFDR
nr:hypothetical protein CFP56_24653 [Quercus suber]